MSATAISVYAANNYGCCEGEKPTPAAGVNILRISATIIIILSIISIGVDLGVYTYVSNVKIGAFWVGIIALPASLMALYPNKRSLVISICVFASIAVIVGIIGSIVDGVGALVVSNIKTCANAAGKVWGDAHNLNAGICILAYGNQHDLVCTDNSSCLFYDGRTNGDDIMKTFKSMLQAAVVFNVIVTILTFYLSIVTCVNLCGCCVSQCGDSNAIPTADVRLDPISPNNAEPVKAIYGEVIRANHPQNRGVVLNAVL